MEAARRKTVRRWCIRILLVASLFVLWLLFEAFFLNRGLFTRFFFPPSVEQYDRYNDLAYDWHYRSLDSVEFYLDKTAHSPLVQQNYPDGLAEAENNRAFVSIVKMNYDEAEHHLNRIPQLTDNQLELLVCYVQQMRLCQRRSRNREFYDYREKAQQALGRINEERHLLTDRQYRRLLYAESELAIVTSTYYYYVGLEQKSIDALAQVPDEVSQDTAQFLNYLYNVGAGGIITEGTKPEIEQQEFDYLIRCFQIARQHHYPYFAANALEALAEHLAEPDSRLRLIDDNAPAMKLINPEGISTEDLPIWLADNALATFREYGDVYQIAGAYRTLASCYRAQGDYESALFNLELSLSDTLILQAPDLVASIREQLSVAYAAVNDKSLSDENRNIYLDLQEQTRQDRYLEARADQLNQTVIQLNWMLLAVVVAIVLLVFLLWLFFYLNQRQKPDTSLSEELEQKREELALCRLHVENSERRHLEQRAKISLVNSITPLIDRMLHEVRRLDNLNSEAAQESLDYIHELLTQINEYNDVLSHWIQLRQGELSLHIESFPLQPLFDIVARSRVSFQIKDVNFHVNPTPLAVKADRVLTLFMLNTLADNARKFTHEGGTVSVSASEAADYVEVSVQDTGEGISEEELPHIFEHRISGGHGFGLLNCKGIIEKYRKVSRIFSVCALEAESQEGRGSRFFFRLPKGRIGCWLLGAFLLTGGSARVLADNHPAQPDAFLDQAAVYADSAYFSNINGTFERTLVFADSCLYYLNKHYLSTHPRQRHHLLQLRADSLASATEISWLHDSVQTNYNLILGIRNESAVAALALHEWQLYYSNNKIYTHLFKELSADSTLSDYCRTMQQSQTNRTIAIILLLLVLLSIGPAYYFLYLRPRLHHRYDVERQLRRQLEDMDDQLRRSQMEADRLHVANAVLDNCLSTLKHETMYYPSRIAQLTDGSQMQEVASYYRELYGILSLQAQRQTEWGKLRLAPQEHGILGDENLLRYLFEILRKQSGQKDLSVSYADKGDHYVEATVAMPSLRLTAEEAQQLFTPAAERIPYLLCRQIVRDHGEATGRRGCGISAETSPDGGILIRIILPRVNKKS